MDSYSFHFERMSNIDLHPLSLSVSRLSPAKSNSSIADQLAHHQHGKGDSAYSSFSGGSNAPDYPTAFLPEDLQSSHFSHYADLKYVKSIYHPNQVLQSDSKTMDQLYRSVEAISQQYRNSTNNNVNLHNHSGNNGFHTNNKTLSKHDVPFVRPPPVPARMDSYIATKNFENSRVPQQDTDLQTPQTHTDTKHQPRLSNLLYPLPQTLTNPRLDTVNPDTGLPSCNSDRMLSVWRGPQQQQAQAQQLPIYRPHLQPHDQTRGNQQFNPEYLFITDNKSAPEQQKSTNSLSRSPQCAMSQPDHLKSTQPLSNAGCNANLQNKASGSSSRFENQRKRAHSADDWISTEPNRAASPWNSNQSFMNSSIQHKGQFYFVTGVCKPSESSMRAHSSSVCGSETGSESSTVLETHSLREKERCHSTMDSLFRPLQESSRSSSGMILDEEEVFHPVPRSQDQENRRLSVTSMKSSRSFDALEEIEMNQSRDIGRHTASNPIFYCGPERNCQTASVMKPKEITTPTSNQQANHAKKEEQSKRGKRQPLADVASERINKETTPLLYHLTGASRAALQLKKTADYNTKGHEATKAGHGDVVNDKERLPKMDTSKNDKGDVVSSACNTLDDSFKKYYKEKLKDAQSKVLRETSFKRRDLQLSWPHRLRQKPELRPAVIHTFSLSQDSETSTDTITPSQTSEETEKGSIWEDTSESLREIDKETEKENGKPANVAQPQVARIGGRRRLTPEQKKMCYSEPEKLNQLGGTPVHAACRSFGNESDNVFVNEYEEEERAHQGEQGLVAARRKIFETRGRALSASCASKNNLKHLQHKALVEYMERKTGQKVVEPQPPAPQVPTPSRQRHSLGEKPFDWGPRPLSATPHLNMRKKLNRPHSAGRILDSSTSSVRYAQFFSAQSCSGQYVGQSNQPRWRESHGPSQVKAASVESLLDQPEASSFIRNRSRSTPHAFQVLEKDPLPVDTMETWSSQRFGTEDSFMRALPEGQQRVRVVAQRGKSMEELGASKLTRLSGLSKSSEQLDQISRRSAVPGGPDRDKRSVSFFREAQEQEGGRKKQNVIEQVREIVGLKKTQEQTQNQTQKRSLLRQSSEPEQDASAGTRNSSRSTSPASQSSSSWARVHSGSPDSHSPVETTRLPTETTSNPPSPRGLETSEGEIKSPSSTSSTLTRLSIESRPSSRVRASPSLAGSEREQSVDESSDEAPPDESNHEVALSCGVTTDPSLWIIPPEEEIREEVQTSQLTDSVFEEESTSPAPPSQTSKASASPCSSVSDADISQQVEEERNPETEDEKPEEKQEMEERGTPEGETESQERPTEKLKWEELVEAVVKADQSLVRVLCPLTNRKTALMLMEQLLSEDTLLMEEHYKKKQELRGAAESVEPAEGTAPPPCPATDSLVSQCTELQSKADITEKKRLLVSHIEARLKSLEETRNALQVEIQENMAHGETLEVLVCERCLPVELERYKLFIGDLERVVNLLLCLSARLARVQNALSTVDQHTDAEEKQSLDSRHRLLCKQREDAKDLKDNLDRRENLVSTFLSRQLSAEQLQDYRRFVQTKASLLIRQKDLEEKQRLGEEQLEALSNSMSL